MTPLEAARNLQNAIKKYSHHHYEYVGTRADGAGTYSWCRFCDHGWPCDGQMVTDAAASMPQIVAALEAAQALVDASAQLGTIRVLEEPKTLGDRQYEALRRLWELGVRPTDLMQSGHEG